MGLIGAYRYWPIRKKAYRSYPASKAMIWGVRYEGCILHVQSVIYDGIYWSESCKFCINLVSSHCETIHINKSIFFWLIIYPHLFTAALRKVLENNFFKYRLFAAIISYIGSNLHFSVLIRKFIVFPYSATL